MTLHNVTSQACGRSHGAIQIDWRSGSSLPSVDRSMVSRETSAAKESRFSSSAVRQTPLTAIESPSARVLGNCLRRDHYARVFTASLIERTLQVLQ